MLLFLNPSLYFPSRCPASICTCSLWPLPPISIVLQPSDKLSSATTEYFQIWFRLTNLENVDLKVHKRFFSETEESLVYYLGLFGQVQVR